MNRTRLAIAAIASVTVLASAAVRADVKTEEKTRMQFGGTMGRVIGVFGGRAMRDGVVSTVAVQGDRKMTVTERTAQLIDLAEQKVYDIDLRDKSYRVTTFDQLRRRLEEAEQKARREADVPDEPANAGQADAPAKEYEIDFELKDTGQTRAIGGYDTREVLMTITVREKGKKIEESGGIATTAHIWLGPRIEALNEIAEFDRRYAAALELPFSGVSSAEALSSRRSQTSSPVPPARITMRSFSRCRIARRWMYGSATVSMRMAVMRRVAQPMLSRQLCRAMPLRTVASMPM